MHVKNLHGLIDVYSDLDLDFEYIFKMIEETPARTALTEWLDRGIPSAPMIKSTLLDLPEDDKYGWSKYTKHMHQVYDEVVNDYIERHGITLTNQGHDSITFNRYSGGGQMSFHCDHPMNSHHEIECPKLSITSNLYLNDDYDGGEIEFSIGTAFTPGGRESIEKYKPKAGEMLVFPSGIPYYHRVHETTNGQKYFAIRFITEHLPAGTSPSWQQQI